MNSIASHISDKLEVFRIEGNKPSYMGVTIEVLTQLNSELSKAREKEVDVRREDFLGVPVIVMSMADMPADGVYIHHRKED